MTKEKVQEMAFEIIMNSGEARSLAMEAISEAKAGNFEAAHNMVNSAREEIGKAHKFQTTLIQAEASGEESPIGVLLIHSQDHLMTAMTVIDMAAEFVDLYETIKK